MVNKEEKRVVYPIKQVYLALLVLGILLTGVVSLLNKPKPNKIPVVQTSPTPAEIYPIDIDKDGVYTNRKYGFKFKYPKDVFIKRFTDSMPDKTGTIKREWFEDKVSNKLFLNLVIMPESQSKSYYPEFEQLQTMKAGDEIGLLETSYSKVLSNVETNGSRAVVYYKETDHSTEEKLVIYSYRVVWKKDAFTIILDLNSDNKNNLKQNKNLFDNILEALEFF